MPDVPIGGDPVALTPECFDRHDAAVEYVQTMSRTREPFQRDGRFPGVIPAAWGLLAAGGTITAGVGKVLGVGVVKLCDRAGTVPEDTPDTNVKNAGAAITAGADRMVLLKWVEDEWAVACVGGS